MLNRGASLRCKGLAKHCKRIAASTGHLVRVNSFKDLRGEHKHGGLARLHTVDAAQEAADIECHRSAGAAGHGANHKDQRSFLRSVLVLAGDLSVQFVEFRVSLNLV